MAPSGLASRSLRGPSPGGGAAGAVSESAPGRGAFTWLARREVRVAIPGLEHHDDLSDDEKAAFRDKMYPAARAAYIERAGDEGEKLIAPIVTDLRSSLREAYREAGATAVAGSRAVLDALTR